MNGLPQSSCSLATAIITLSMCTVGKLQVGNPKTDKTVTEANTGMTQERVIPIFL